MIFMSCYVPTERMNDIVKKSKQVTSNAVNLFQWNLLSGFEANHVSNMNVFNALPVGAWPKHYQQIILERSTYKTDDCSYTEVGTINIPIFKQISRYLGAFLYLRASKDKDVLIYSTYLPFLAAATNKWIKKSITLIVTDLPEYYDLTEDQPFFRKWARKIVSKLTYRYIKRVNKFVLLTEAMHEALSVGDRPYIVMEGLVSGHSDIYKNKSVNNPVRQIDKNIILYTGTLNYKYGILDLIDVLEKNKEASFEMWICGGGEAEELIKETAKSDERLKYFGFVNIDKVWELQKKATILVNPRKPEDTYTKYSFPSKTMEYMLSGTPVVMYNLEGIPSEYCNYLYYVSENEALSDCIKRVLNIPESIRREKGYEAQGFIQKNKNSKRQIERILRLIANTKLGDR